MKGDDLYDEDGIDGPFEKAMAEPITLPAADARQRSRLLPLFGGTFEPGIVGR